MVSPLKVTETVEDILELNTLQAWKIQRYLSHYQADKVLKIYQNLVCLSVCLSVCLYQINVKTAEPIGPKFFVGHLGTPGKVYENQNFKYLSPSSAIFIYI